MDAGAIFVLCIVYLLLAVISGFIGLNRKIGFGTAFGISIFFTPWVGVILAFLSPHIDEMKVEQSRKDLSNMNLKILIEIAKSSGVSDETITEIIKSIK